MKCLRYLWWSNIIESGLIVKDTARQVGVQSSVIAQPVIQESTPQVSVVILNYNGKHHLRTCLDSVLRTNYPSFDVFLVDNCSGDGSIEFVRENYPQVRVVPLNENLGSSAGYMAGIARASGKYVSLLNNDVEVDSDWLKHLVNALEADPMLAGADSKFRNYYNRERFDDSAAAGRLIDCIGNNYTRGVNEVDTGQYDVPTYIFGVLTIFRRDVLTRIGGFDTNFFYGYEDIDLGWRIYLAGSKVLYVPKSIIFHKSGATSRTGELRRMRPRLYFFTKRNRLITLVKNYSAWNAIRFLLAVTLEYLAAASYQAAKRDVDYSRSQIEALVYLFTNLREVMKMRSHVQSMRVLSDSEIMRYMAPYSGDILKILSRKTRPIRLASPKGPYLTKPTKEIKSSEL